MKRNAAFLVICGIFLLLPILFFNWKPDQVSATENRMLAEPISLSSGISAYMESLDDCVNDRIGFREHLVRLYRNLMVHTFKIGGEVIIGKDGWLFYHEDIPDYTGANIDLKQIDYQVSILREISDWCKQRDITFVFMIGPNKSTVYSQYMPDYLIPAETTRMDILVERLNQAGVLTICPKGDLLENRDSEELYAKLDTHWNQFGAFYALDALCEHLNLETPRLEINSSYSCTGDLKNMLNVSSYPSESKWTEIKPYENARVEKKEDSLDLVIHSSDGKKFVCYRDSFGKALVDPFTYLFSGPMYWNYKIDFNFVEKESPEFLILECVERGLSWDVIEKNADIFERK